MYLKKSQFFLNVCKKDNFKEKIIAFNRGNIEFYETFKCRFLLPKYGFHKFQNPHTFKVQSIDTYHLYWQPY